MVQKVGFPPCFYTPIHCFSLFRCLLSAALQLPNDDEDMEAWKNQLNKKLLCPIIKQLYYYNILYKGS